MGEALEIFAILMAVVVPFCLPFFVSRYLDYKKTTNAELGKLRDQIEANSTSDLVKELEAAKERIAVLESIVTDRGYELERKISNL